ncbi:MAG: CvpA family protein [Lachnospiraceae bacterium]|nr:CvpA family protein [Lachnospiraceae bacterium]
MKIAFLLIALLIVVCGVKKGFKNGMMSEIVSILSIIVSCVCIALVFLTVSSVLAKTFSTLVVCVIGLIGIGIVFKICNLIFKPIMGIANISIIGGLDKILGAIIGFAESAFAIFFLYKVLDYFGIYIF